MTAEAVEDERGRKKEKKKKKTNVRGAKGSHIMTALHDEDLLQQTNWWLGEL